jgi:hypothetical protein
VLAEEDPAAFALTSDAIAVAGMTATTEQVAAARRELFSGYGSCSWSEPVEDLLSLGMLG